MRSIAIAALAAACLLPACAQEPAEQEPAETAAPANAYPSLPEEPHLTNLRMLTQRGQNAEAYFSADGQKLIFQATRPGESACDQIFTMDIDGQNVRRVSTGQGKTTCSYFYPSGQRILYSSTHENDAACPAAPDFSQGYVWPLDEHDIYTANVDGSGLQRLTNSPGYDAEATISPDGSRIVFTSVRDGDLEIYTMAADGSDVRRLTDRPGYDGGAFFSPDGSKIVYRAYYPPNESSLADYRSLLEQKMIRPTQLEIWTMNADGSNKQQVTSNGKANFAPFFHPSGQKIIFSSNLHDPAGRDFDLYLINLDGSGLERVTYSPEFDGFPMFSPDGTQLAFASNRGGQVEGDTNIFLADWVD